MIIGFKITNGLSDNGVVCELCNRNFALLLYHFSHSQDQDLHKLSTVYFPVAHTAVAEFLQDVHEDPQDLPVVIVKDVVYRGGAGIVLIETDHTHPHQFIETDAVYQSVVYDIGKEQTVYQFQILTMGIIVDTAVVNNEIGAFFKGDRIPVQCLYGSTFRDVTT